MKNFKTALEDKIRQSQFNDFGVENFDIRRFGSYQENNDTSLAVASPAVRAKDNLKSWVKKAIGYGSKEFVESGISTIDPYLDKLQFFWERLNPEGKDLLVDIIAYRLLGYTKIKLPTNNPEYREALEKTAGLKNEKDTYDPHFLHFILNKFDLRDVGYDVQLYFRDVGIAIAFIIEQYAYKLRNEYVVSVKKGDVVLDLGACWGDTALYFADKAGPDGKVYSFEFIPGNIALFEKNIALNPSLLGRIELVRHPVANTTGTKIYYLDNGPGSRIEMEPFDGQTGSTTTITIDDLVRSKNLAKVDFIKMDIEGAEPMALQGAIETIKKHRPKLAIAIYHSMDDLTNIPQWVADLNLGYKMYIGHYTIHAEETVLFATCE